MISEELQKLIDASLVDGIITDQERAVIKKRALLDGTDPDEIDLILNSKLQELRKEQEAAIPKVKKCPNCGNVIPAMATSCPTCGYEFRNLEANNSIKALADKLEQIELAYRHKGKGGFWEDNTRKKDEEQASVIKNFPIPSTKEDIFEFMVTMRSRFRNEDDGPIRNAYKAKYEETLEKARVLFPDDPQFASLIETKNGFAKIIEWWKNSSFGTKFIIIDLALLAILFIIIAISES